MLPLPPHPALRATFPVGEGFSDDGKVLAKAQSFRVRLLPLGELRAATEGLRMEKRKSVKAIAPTGAALAFLCFDFFL